MGIYVGAPAIGTFIVTVPMCFTANEAKLARGAIAATEALLFALGGMLIGGLVGLLVSPMGALVGALIGSVIGLIVGGVVGVLACSAGACPCPPGCEGFCMRLLYGRVPGTNILIPLVPFVSADAASCPVLVPPGCP